MDFFNPLPARCRPLPLACLLGLLGAALGAQAEPSARAGQPDPLDPRASVPALVYRSSLPPVRSGADDKPVAWRDANDSVAAIGGWRVYARQARQPDPLPGAQPPPATPAAGPSGHAGHKMP